MIFQCLQLWAAPLSDGEHVGRSYIGIVEWQVAHDGHRHVPEPFAVVVVARIQARELTEVVGDWRARRELEGGCDDERASVHVISSSTGT